MPALSEKLAVLAAQMSLAERACLKILFGAAAAEFLAADQHAKSTASPSLSVAIEAIALLQPHHTRVPPDGIAYVGRPDFVTPALVDLLQQESRRVRSEAVRFHDHFVTSGAPNARSVAFSSEMIEFVRVYAGEVEPTSKANYLYYDEPGLGIEPHVDNEEFSLNVIMMLEHEDTDAAKDQHEPSALVLYPPSAPPRRLRLQPGELVVMFADSVIHARERVKLGERISIVAFGFAPN